MTTTAHRRIRRTAIAASIGAPLAALAVLAVPAVSQARDVDARATLKTAHGTQLGTVTFRVSGDKTEVSAKLRLPAALGRRDAFHGFHIHANNDPANGKGCLANPAKPPATWFVSADGHLSDVGQTHGAHKGDLPSLLVSKDGTTEIRFTTQRLTVADLRNRAVIFHAGPDNFSNIPVGKAPDQYRPNSPAATAKTASTGNAGDRLACGVISIRHG